MAEPIDIDARRTAIKRFMAFAVGAWTAFFLTDLVAVQAHGAPLEYLAAIRFAGTGVGLAAFAAVSARSAGPRTFAFVEATVFPAAAFLVSLAAIPCGGVASPLAIGVGTITLSRAILPAPFTRAFGSALAASLCFPVVMLAAATRLPVMSDQLHSAARWTFLLTSSFLVLSAAVSAAGSHLQWAAKEEVQDLRRLGQYRLVVRIGSGGMGEVWLARQMPLDRPVALKILKQRTADESGALRRFKREALSASRLTHPHTIKVFDFGASDDGVFYIAMELLDGLDLEQLIGESGSLHPARVIHLARQACASLAEAHAAGIIHCDIKPANLFIAKVGSDLDFVKVLDFGLARVLTGPGATTVVDSIRGTPAFMPPEVVRGEPVGPESDVYSMGALLYFMLTATPVFQGLGFHEMVIAQLEGIPESPSKRLGRALPRDLEAIVLRCLSKDRTVRFPTAKELEEALAKCELAGKWKPDDAHAAWTEVRPSLAMKVARRS